MSLPRLSELRLNETDLHLHAGTERAEHHSVDDYLQYLVSSGRKVLGITDHWGRYFRRSPKYHAHYEASAEGFETYANEVKSAAKKYPNVLVLFGPEVGFGAKIEGVAEEMFTLPQVEYFLGEPGGGKPDMRYGEYLVEGIEWIADLRERYGRPAFVAHPLRHAVNSIVGRSGREADGSLRSPLYGPTPALDTIGEKVDHVSQYFDIDIEELAKALVKHDVPVELNESTIGRALAHNAMPFLERYLFFYRTLLDRGVSPVLSSDQHSIEHPSPTPFHFAWLLGIEVRDITFLRQWIKE